MRRLEFPILAGGLLLGGPAHADELSTARGLDLDEVSHTVRVTIEDGVARYRVRRVFDNHGDRAEEARLRLQLAPGAAATGLRIRARDRWYSGDLMDAEEASDKYQELTGVGEWEPKDPALLEWLWADVARLRVFPVLPGKRSTVEYTLTAPLEYRDGRYVIAYPRLEGGTDSERALVAPTISVDPGWGNAFIPIRIDGVRARRNQALPLGVATPPAWVGEGAPDPSNGLVISALAIREAIVATTATVNVAIDHTYQADLRVMLVLPDGSHMEVAHGVDDANDLRGAYELTLPDVSTMGTWHLIVEDQAGLDIGSLDAWSIELRGDGGVQPVHGRARGLPQFIPDARDGDGDGGLAVIEIAPPPIDTVAGRLGKVVASAEKGFGRLELDVAPQLRPLPRKASVVFVVDASHSSAEVLGENLRIIDGYLRHVPDAQVEIVRFDRKARRIFGSMRSAADARTELSKAHGAGLLDPGNGSALDEGLRLAAEILASRTGPTRIVALTDTELRTRFRNAMATGALGAAPRDTIVHLVEPAGEGRVSLQRVDTDVLAPIAAATGGVFFSASIPDDAKPSIVKETMLELVRPIRIDDFSVAGFGGDTPFDEALLEGQGVRAMVAMVSPPDAVTLRGKIWGANFERVVMHAPAFDRATAAFVFSEDEHHDLTKEEMRTVAFFGGAVSPVTSYLAIEPGVRPSTEGLEEGFGVGGFGLSGSGSGGGGIGVSIPLLGEPPLLSDLLRANANACALRHGAPKTWSVELNVETTWDEIVDVVVSSASHADIGTCIEEAAWARRLPAALWPDRQEHTVTLAR